MQFRNQDNNNDWNSQEEYNMENNFVENQVVYDSTKDIYDEDNILKSNRLDDESFEDYKKRMKLINAMIKRRIKYGVNVIAK